MNCKFHTKTFHFIYVIIKFKIAPHIADVLAWGTKVAIKRGMYDAKDPV